MSENIDLQEAREYALMLGTTTNLNAAELIANLCEKVESFENAISEWANNPTTGNECKLKELINHE